MNSQYDNHHADRDPPRGAGRTAIDVLVTGNAALARQLDELPSLDGRITRRTVELAKLVLVGGMSQAEAARAAGVVHRQDVHRAIKVVKRALTRGVVCKVCGNKPGGTK